MRIAVLGLAALGLIGCSKKAEPSDVDAWIPPVGQMMPAACTKDADGHR